MPDGAQPSGGSRPARAAPSALALLVIACGATWTAPVQAQAPPDASASSDAGAPHPVAAPAALARTLYDRARTEYEAERYAVALGLLRQAYVLSPAPGLLFDIAQCERKLGRCHEARATYGEYARQEADPARRTRAERLRDTLSDCAAPATPAPAPAPSPSPPPRPPLTKPPRPAAAKPSSTAPGASRSAPALSIAKWSLLAAGAAASAFTVYFVLDARSASSDISNAREWNSELSDREERGKRSAALAWVFGGASAALLGSGLALHLLDQPGARPRLGTLQLRPSHGAFTAAWSRAF
jgi:hypothetical protein